MMSIATNTPVMTIASSQARRRCASSPTAERIRSAAIGTKITVNASRYSASLIRSGNCRTSPMRVSDSASPRDDEEDEDRP